MNACVHVHIYIHTYIHTYIHIYIYNIHTHTQVHIHVNTNTHKKNQPEATGVDAAAGVPKLLLLLRPSDGNASAPSEGKASAEGGPWCEDAKVCDVVSVSFQLGPDTAAGDAAAVEYTHEEVKTRVEKLLKI